ncbi:MAG: hypothetical protein IBJ09_06430 [Bacteroidia bacterium]|nr:hypothetical protein [Bacteroidia bacterium]
MTNEEKEQILTLIEEMEGLNIWSAAHQQFPDRDIETLEINGFLFKTLVHKYERALKQLKTELSAETWMYMPNALNFLTPSNDFTLANNLTRLKNYVTVTPNMGGFQVELMNQVRYQMMWGFWDRSNRKVHDVNALEVEKAVKEIQRGKKDLESQQKMIDNLRERVDQKTEEVNTLINTLNESINEILKQKTESEQKNIEIQQILNVANEHKSKIETSEKIIDIAIHDFQAKGENIGKTLIDFQNESKTLSAKLSELISRSEKKLKLINDAYSEVDGMKEFIQIKEAEIIRIAEQASNGAMGIMFENRKINLGKKVNQWMWGTLLASVGLLVWIFIVFAFLYGERYEPEWLNPLLATLKTVPAFIVVAFCSNQYMKERNLQEEYAFKASIAMTLSAYADAIEYSEDSDRRELIKKSIERIYQQPQIKKEHYGLFDLARKKKREELLHYIKEALDVIKKNQT